VSAGEPGFDCGLALAEPVKGAAELDLVDRAELQQPTQARTGGVGGEIACGGELGSGADQPAGDQRDGQRGKTLVGRFAEQPVETDRP
jgi:hypothetical protein